MSFRDYNYRDQTMDAFNSKIGKGLKLDGMMSPTKGTPEYNTGIERINQSIKNILDTRQGERFFLPDFGSKLHLLLFERNTYLFQDLAELYIREALSIWEPRITILNITIPPSTEDNIVNITINYMLSNTNRTVSYVYPYVRSPRPLGGDSIEY